MLLLRFTFENHRSFRDEQDLTLVQPRLRTSRPHDGTWHDYTNRVAAIYGANASGKSGVIDAVQYMQAVVSHSASSWTNRKSLPGSAFALCKDARKRPSTYSIDFVFDGVRHEYGFSLNSRAILEEWLYTYPTGRRRVLFERGGDGSLTFGRDLKGGEAAIRKAIGERELVLSKGASIRHPGLKEIFDEIVDGLTVARFEETDRQSRLRSVMEDVAEGKLSIDDLQLMLKVADVGILGAEVTEQETPAGVKRILRAIFRAGMAEDEGEQGGDDAPSSEDDEDDEVVFSKMSDDEIEKAITEATRSLQFRHKGEDGVLYALPTRDQSTGTLTWLSLAAPALRMLRKGGVLLVDELDASLHPQLAQVMIQMFRDDRLNRSGAQLVFTTHDTYFLSPTSDVRLRPDEVWITEKRSDGSSELYSVSEFPTRVEDNLSRRYLQGRYGGVPAVAPSFLAALAEGEDEESADDGIALTQIP